jgi:hypothetical protein
LKHSAVYIANKTKKNHDATFAKSHVVCYIRRIRKDQLFRFIVQNDCKHEPSPGAKGLQSIVTHNGHIRI